MSGWVCVGEGGVGGLELARKHAGGAARQGCGRQGSSRGGRRAPATPPAPPRPPPSLRGAPAVCVGRRLEHQVAKDGASLGGGDLDVGADGALRAGGQRVLLRPLHELEVPHRGQLQSHVLHGGGRAVDHRHVQHNVVLVHCVCRREGRGGGGAVSGGTIRVRGAMQPPGCACSLSQPTPPLLPHAPPPPPPLLLLLLTRHVGLCVDGVAEARQLHHLVQLAASGGGGLGRACGARQVRVRLRGGGRAVGGVGVSARGRSCCALLVDQAGAAAAAAAHSRPPLALAQHAPCCSTSAAARAWSSISNVLIPLRILRWWKSISSSG